MQTVTKEAFAELFQQCIALALEETQKQVTDPLPKELYLGLEAFGQVEKLCRWRKCYPSSIATEPFHASSISPSEASEKGGPSSGYVLLDTPT